MAAADCPRGDASTSGASYGLTSIFANPGSTEIPLLADLPDDFRFVLALHEGSVVGMATGWAIGRDEPALAILHTTAGLGNAVGALATARVNRAPLVVLVGQQDRRHLASEPFLAGKLRRARGRLSGVGRPARARRRTCRARSRARATRRSTGRGPALVIVPMDDWAAEAAPADERAAPRRVVRCAARPSRRRRAARRAVRGSRAPGARGRARAPTMPTPGARSWRSPSGSACPVWQESFSARAGFPQDHPLFAGHLPADRARLRATLAPHDLVLAVGAPVLRQYPFIAGPVRRARDDASPMITGDPAEVHRSPAELAVLARAGAASAPSSRAIAAAARGRGAASRLDVPPPPAPPAPGEPLRAGHVFAAIAERHARATRS